jgi:hypothetical protein
MEPQTSRRAVLTALACAAMDGTVGLSARAAGAVGGADASDGGYARTDYTFRRLDFAELPYNFGAARSLVREGEVYDSAGVSMFVFNGRHFDHPVLQAQFMNSRLSSYHYNRDGAYLRRILAHGDRLLANAVTSGGALYFPYPFDFPLHGNTSDLMRAPWYSGMAQGLALSAFSRLYLETKDARHLRIADQIFASFRPRRREGVPWVSTVDDAGYLWFEEYPRRVRSDRAFNGHIFAVNGLYDYHRATGRSAAMHLWQAGVTAAAGHLPEIRNPGWISRYCMTHGTQSAKYHVVHIGQLYMLYAMTGARQFARAGDQFISDFPGHQDGGNGYLGTGTVEGLAPNGRSRTFAVTVAEAVVVGRRVGWRGRPGIWLEITSGTLAGNWTREVPGTVFLKGYIEQYHFPLPRPLMIVPGTYTAFRYNDSGVRTESLAARMAHPSVAHVDRRAVIAGRLHFRVIDGAWSDHWLPSQAGVELV